MIAGLAGTVVETGVDYMHLDVNGVIYRIGSSTATLTSLAPDGASTRLYTHLVVREDQLALFGFTSAQELQMFESLVSVTGVGPKVACAILSKFGVDDLINTIHAGNADMLATVSGVGKKTAGRLIVDLRGKLPDQQASGPSPSPVDDEVVEALRSLGYAAAEAAAAVATLPDSAPDTVEERVVAALQQLGRQ